MIILSILLTIKIKKFKKYLKEGRPNSVYENLQIITWNLTEAISSSKSDYYERLANKLNDPPPSSKVYWSIIKTLVNGTKVAVLLPILVKNKLGISFKNNANIFNYLFSKQCELIPNNGTLPSI